MISTHKEKKAYTKITIILWQCRRRKDFGFDVFLFKLINNVASIYSFPETYQHILLSFITLPIFFKENYYIKFFINSVTSRSLVSS